MKIICRLLAAFALAAAMASASAAQQFSVTWGGATVLTNVVITATINATDTANVTGTVYDTTGVLSGSVNGQAIISVNGRFVLGSSTGSPFSTDGLNFISGRVLALGFNVGGNSSPEYSLLDGRVSNVGVAGEVWLSDSVSNPQVTDGPFPATTINIAAVPIDFGGFLSSFLAMVLGALLILRRIRSNTTPIDP